MLSEVHQIHIDCAPGTPRPDTYMKEICENILHTKNIPECISMFFGDWVYEVECTKEEHEKIAEYLKDIYNKGYIRYAAW